MVPHLATALQGPINELEQRILDGMPAIERWFRLEWMEHTPPFYGAVNVRNAGYKLAPIYSDLFPSGWNHLSEEVLPLAVQAGTAAIEKICPEAKNLLIVPSNQATEDAWRKSSYLSNLLQLKRVFQLAGLNVRFGSINPQLTQAQTLVLPDGQSITLEPAARDPRRLGLANFDPCTILLNQSLDTGVPGILEELHEQNLLPPLHAADASRLNSRFLSAYDEIAKRFAKLIGIDPWLINPLYELLPTLTASNAANVELLGEKVDALLGKIRRKYKDYGIHEQAVVEIKCNSRRGKGGVLAISQSAGLGALLAKVEAEHGDDIDLSAGLVLQEAVMTQERVNDRLAQPVVYTMDRYVVGGFYKVQAQADASATCQVDAPLFLPLAFERSSHLPDPEYKPGASVPNRFYMYGVVARLAMLAVSYELEATDPNAEAEGFL
jgi:glutamate--cysteine ligase